MIDIDIMDLKQYISNQIWYLIVAETALNI